MSARDACLICVWVLFGTYALGQTSLNKLYDFGFSGVSFANVIESSDSLIVYGNCLSETEPYWGVFLARIDTFGNVHCLAPMYDSTTRLLPEKNPTILHSSDSYVTTGVRSNSPFVLRNSKNCGSGQITYFPDSETFVKVSDKSVLVDSNMVLMAGWRQELDYETNAFVMAVNADDSVGWELVYGAQDLREFAVSLVKMDKHHSAIGVRTSNLFWLPNDIQKYWTQVVAIDNDGAVLSVWGSDTLETNENGAYGLKHVNENGWIYITSTYEAIDSSKGWWGGAIKVVRRDANFDLLWERRLSPEVDVWNEAIDVQPSGDGNWIAGGRYLAHDNYPEQYPWYGIGLSKITDDGDILWSVLEASPEDTMVHWDNFLGGFTVLSSGSIIAAGYSNVYEPVAKSWAWLLKVTADGCVDTLCMTTPTEDVLLPMSDVVTSPNPTRGAVTFSFDVDMTTERSLTLYGSDGSVLGRKNVPRGQASVEMDLSDEVPGLYFYTLESRGRLVGQGKVVRVE